jgi:hypothetical protein
VQSFLKAFVDIVLWRKGPQDLPSSRLLVALTLLAYVLVTLLQLSLMHERASAYVMFAIVDPILLMTWIWVVLKVYRRPERYPQTIAAILGSTALLGLGLVPLQVLVGVQSVATATPSAQILALGMIVVFVLVAGRILKLATESNLFTGFCIAAVYVFVLNTVAFQIVSHGT